MVGVGIVYLRNNNSVEDDGGQMARLKRVNGFEN